MWATSVMDEFGVQMTPTKSPSQIRPKDAAQAVTDFLAEVRRHDEAATKGPWVSPSKEGFTPVDHEGCDVWPWWEEADMNFACAARTDLPRAARALEYTLGIVEAQLGPGVVLQTKKQIARILEEE